MTIDARSIGALVLLLLIAGCSGGVRRDGPPAPVVSSQGERGVAAAPTGPAGDGVEIRGYSGVAGEPAEVQSYEPVAAPDTAAPAASGAVVALLDDAGRQQRQGDLAAAVRTLERALRIEPRNATLWQELALLRVRQGKYRMGADLAAKSNSLAGDDRVLQRQNWQLIARARRALGDSDGARQAEQMARSLRQ